MHLERSLQKRSVPTLDGGFVGERMERLRLLRADADLKEYRMYHNIHFTGSYCPRDFRDMPALTSYWTRRSSRFNRLATLLTSTVGIGLVPSRRNEIYEHFDGRRNYFFSGPVVASRILDAPRLKMFSLSQTCCRI